MNKINKHTSSNLDKYNCTNSFAVKRIANFYDNIIKLVSHVKHSNILSVGCGECFDVQSILDSSKIKYEYCCGFDLNLDSLKMARKTMTHLRLDVINGDIDHLPFKLNKFDIIFCLEVLEHLTNPDNVLKEIHHNFNGYCVFSVPNEPLYRLTRAFIYRLNIKELGNHPEHLNNWSKRKFSRLIKKYFEIDQIIASFPWTIVLCHSKDMKK